MPNAIFGSPQYYKIDSNSGRFRVPAEFRELLGNTIYVLYLREQLVRCYPGEVYESRLEEMLSHPHDDQERQRFFLVDKVQLDDQHRLTLRGKIGSLNQVIVAPNGNVLDIYDPKSFPYPELLGEPPTDGNSS